MKTLRKMITAIMIAVGGVFCFSCEDATESELARHQIPAEKYIPNPPHQRIPYVKRIIKRDFKDARGWRIIWGGGSIEGTDIYKVPAIFSTITGGVNSVQYLNGTSPQNTSNADMWIYFGLEATSEISALNYDNHTRKTRFKLSGMTVADLQNAAENNPALLAIAYEWDLNEPTGSLEIGDYQAGQIFTFKTDRSPAKYGAVRIVDKSPLTVEVVVQK